MSRSKPHIGSCRERPRRLRRFLVGRSPCSSRPKTFQSALLFQDGSVGFRYCIYDKTEKLADLSLELESLGRHVCGVVWCGDLEDERLVMKLGVGKQPLVNTIRGEAHV